jgi:hypothetical protein
MADKHEKAAKAEAAKPVETPVTPSPVDVPASYQTTEDGSVEHQPPSSPKARPSPPVADGSAPPPVEPPPENPEAEQQQRDDAFRNSRGAQVILDGMSDASLAARGGAGGTIEANTAARDTALLDDDCDPKDPDASHLPYNTVKASGRHVDKAKTEGLEPALKQKQDEADTSVKKA